MKTYAFTIKSVGKGETLEDAWNDAKQTLEQEFNGQLEASDCEPELIEDDEAEECIRHVPAKPDTLQTVCMMCDKAIVPSTADSDVWVLQDDEAE